MRYFLFLLLGVVFLSTGCNPKPPIPDTPVITSSPSTQSIDPKVQKIITVQKDLFARKEHKANRVTIQHILISYKGSGIKASASQDSASQDSDIKASVHRSLDEAELLAAELWERIHQGEDFDTLTKEYTNDKYPGIYRLVILGEGDAAQSTFARTSMVMGFGDMAWRLEVGEVGIVLYHPAKSPYGYHILKRIE